MTALRRLAKSDWVCIDCSPDGVSSLIGSDLRIDSLVVAQSSLGPSEDLKVYPAQADLPQLLVEVLSEKIVTRPAACAASQHPRYKH